ASVLDTSPTASTAVTTTTAVGTYDIDVSGGVDNNYDFSYTKGSLTVEGFLKKYGFSPNGDGINEKWVIKNIELYPDNVVKVFNRYGKLVFEKKRYKNTWKGISNKTSTGKKLPVGSYLFIIELNKNNLKPIQGWLYINY
ncbi:MAG: gliding motility-associated C-terminal domain-containing protein, partial [Flavobacteriaceae bacterium]|nr:gliding motility-associated C-terminal domain-containing protein [Flavobacteriaceae bacterium]